MQTSYILVFFSSALQLSDDATLAESVAISRITYSEMEKKTNRQELAQFTELKVFFTISCELFIYARINII